MNKESSYECSICMDTAKEPVVTKCGHLYCWPCIYDWMEEKNHNTECPICKNPISKENLIPIYTKSESKENNNRFKIPNRPKGQRTEDRNNDRNNNNQGPNVNFFGGFGFFPFFGFNLAWNNNNNNNIRRNYNNNNPPINLNLFQNMNISNDMKVAMIHFATLMLIVYFYLFFNY